MLDSGVLICDGFMGVVRLRNLYQNLHLPLSLSLSLGFRLFEEYTFFNLSDIILPLQAISAIVLTLGTK